MIRLIFITFECKQHPLPPRRVKPVVQPDVVADKDSVDADTVVAPLQEVAQLYVLQVDLEADVVVSGVRHLVPAHALTQHVAVVAGGAAGAVFIRAGRAGGALPHRARYHTLARGVFVGAGAAAGLLQVGADVIVFTAVHDGEDVVQPVAEGPATQTEQQIISTHKQWLHANESEIV